MKNSILCSQDPNKLYLAGPGVFSPSPTLVGFQMKKACEKHGFIGLYPLDNEITSGTKDQIAKEIVLKNMQLIQKCDYVVANLSNFRGTKEFPCCDSGTAWECGYGLAIGKKVIAYTNNRKSIPQIIINSIHLCFEGRFTKVFTYIPNTIFKPIHSSHSFNTNTLFDLDPLHPSHQDANPKSAFILGYRCGKNLICRASLTDLRSSVEKYGEFDRNKYVVENFGKPVNIMISENTEIFQK